MKKWLKAAAEIAVMVVSLSGGISLIVESCGKYGKVCGAAFFCAFFLTIKSFSDDARDGGIEACTNYYKGRLGTQSSKKLSVTCRIDGTEQTIYQSYATVGDRTYWSSSGGCKWATDCPECKQCKLDATLHELEN